MVGFDLSLDTATGWVNNIIHKPSQNYNQRPDKSDLSLLVIHCISLPEGSFVGNEIIDFFQNQLDISKHQSFQALKDVKVSAHFLIRRSGEVIQFVSIYDRAWHAGVSSFQGRGNCNDYSIGIELEGADYLPYEPLQYAALIKLTNLLINHTIINKNRIVAHSEIAPKRKTDPGKYFDWGYYLGCL
ncbi:1,6-anhydro-N-acetylmuramyl-L-alanine amidase AmpD [Thiotrichales bacterium 19S3-7]|nr:1,6-anhydro-N-acetylmuramyl-L-alanine amidase AmpD [Thiotrichales bacterium 19S3-7]MCF6802378.1 1,6-anhydro-N-acetylmuramyl-L-alanine amidase AmpD [Thiotrichales bacterium 19S3-11]